MAVFIVATNVIGLYLAAYDPVLLERRKHVGPTAEARPAQRIIMSLTLLSAIGVLPLSAWDHRVGWSVVSPGLVIIGDVLVALGLWVDFRALRENHYASSTIETMTGQRVITSGPYSRVRHPIYAGALIMMAGVPLALGSLWGLAMIAATIPALVWRIIDEESLLAGELAGYRSYARQVPYRLVPHVW